MSTKTSAKTPAKKAVAKKTSISFKRGMAVRHTGRSGTVLGAKVTGTRQHVNGLFVEIKTDAGVAMRVRPCSLSAAG